MSETKQIRNCSHVQSALLDGDGRQIVEPYVSRTGPLPIGIRRGTCRQIIKMFEDRGESHHSGRGSTLWVVLEHCHSQRIPFTLKTTPGEGYSVYKGIS